MNIPKFIIGILLIIPGAFMIADGVLTMLGQGPIFFQVPDYKFEFIVGCVVVIVGASSMDSKKSK